MRTRLYKILENLRRHDSQRMPLALALALVWHALLLTYIAFLGVPKTTPKVAARVISAAQFASNKRLSRPLTAEQRQKRDELKKQLAEKKTEQEQEKIKKQLEDLTGQIVDLPASPDNKPPENAKYLSEFNTNTKKEQKSRFRDPDYKRATNEVTGAIKAPNPMQSDAKELQQKQDAKQAMAEKKKQQAAMEIPRVDQQDRLSLSIDEKFGALKNKGSSEKVEGNSDRLNIKPGEAGQDAQQAQEGKQAQQGSTPQIKDLMPSVGTMAKIAGAPANDFLNDDVPDGEGTFLNSREFKFAPFFNRLKQSVSHHWKPMPELRRRDPTGNIYGSRSLVTVLSIQINATGEVTNIDVAKSSGIDFLDREAIQAFQKAQPFPNPPKQLMKNGMTEFTFGFHIEFNNRGFGLDF